MIYEIERMTEVERIRDFQICVTDYPNVLFIGGKNIEGAKSSLRMWNLVENKNVPINLIDGKDYDCLKRTGHVCITIGDIIYVIGGDEPFQNSIVELNKKTWDIHSSTLSFDFRHHLVAFHEERKQFLIFTSNVIYFFTHQWEYLDKVFLSPRLFHNQTRFKGVLYGDWFYLFGGYNGISFQKRFFRFHVGSHAVEILPTIPNASNIRISGVEIFRIAEKLYFIMNMCSLSKHNFFYMYDLTSGTWDNYYLLHYENQVEFIDVYKDNRIDLSLRTGMKTYGSFYHDSCIYIFGNDVIFYDYPTVIYKIIIPSVQKPSPSTWYNDMECFDFQISVEDQAFPCHRYVLMKFSGYFRTLFHSSYDEKYVDHISIEGVDAKLFEKILRYMYDYPSFHIDSVDIHKIIPLADYLQMNTLLFDIETLLLQRNIVLEEDLRSLTVFPRYLLFSKSKKKTIQSS